MSDSEEKTGASKESGGGGGGGGSDLGTKKRGLSHRRGSSLTKAGHQRTSSLLPGQLDTSSISAPGLGDDQNLQLNNSNLSDTSTGTGGGGGNDSSLLNDASRNNSGTAASTSRLGQLFSHFRSSDTSQISNSSAGGGGHHRTASTSSLPPLPSIVVREFTAEDKQWELRRTMNGVEYFYNAHTQQIQLDPKPDFLKTFEEWEAEENGGESTWIPHPTLVWQAAKIVKRSASSGEVTVKPLWAASTKLVTIPPNRVWKESGKPDLHLGLWALRESVLDNATDVDDLVGLEDPNEAMMLHVLRERFVVWKKIYTWVGASKSVLISMNPFQPRPELYSEQTMEEQRNDTEASLSVPPPPHLFGLCKGALELCLYDQQNCSVLISGESGAGKTEATKYCLKFLSADSGQDSSSVLETKLVNANLLLEEFGNAKTNRNNNSSRFGKWIQVFYDMKTRKICNSQLTTFLLERSRVVFQNKGEANYHIFNLVLANDYLRAEHGLAQSEWRYITNSGAQAKPDSDFKRILLSLTEIGFEAHEQEGVFQLVASVLHLGELDFELQANDTVKLSSHKRSKAEHRGLLMGRSSVEGGAFHVAETCRLLGLDLAKFETAACFRTVQVRGETSTIAIGLADARNSVDSLAMQLYGRMFDLLLARINASLNSGAKPKKSAWIGLLDIFGFEIFDKNSFEQLCINFCNEKLQQEFNSSTFKEEEGLYRFEEIDFSPIVFKDNVSMLQFVEGKGNGLFAILDDEVRVGGGTDSKFVNKLLQQHDKNPIVVKKKKLESALHFTLQHYAGMVKYDAQGFVQANVETFRNELHHMLHQSSKDFVKHLFPALEEVDGKTRMTKKLTVSTVFRQQLGELMEQIQNTESRYIRCIKPNAQSQANQFDSVLVMEQLRYSGIFETVDIRRLGYPFRKTHVQFVYQFQCIHPLSVYTRSRDDDHRGRCEEILQNIRGPTLALTSGGNIQIGKTRVLYRTKQHHLLVLLRNIALEQRIVPWIQARLRGFIARQVARMCRESDELLKDSLEDHSDVDDMEDAIAEAEERIGERVFRMFPTIRLAHQQALEDKIKLVQEWNSAELEMEELLENDAREVEEKFFDLRSLLKKLEVLAGKTKGDTYEPSRRQERLLDELRDKVTNCTMQQQGKRFQEIQDRALEALQQLDRARMVALQTSFAQDTEIYQPGVQVFVDIAAKLQEMVDKETNVKLAVSLLDRGAMERTSEEAAKLKLNVDECRRLLALPAHEFCKLELQVAQTSADEPRRIHREIFLWEYELEHNTEAPSCAFEQLPYWRTCEEWVNHAKMFTRLFRKERVERGFKAYGKTPIHFPVTSFGPTVVVKSGGSVKKNEPNNVNDTLDRRKLAVQLGKHITPMFLPGGAGKDHDAGLREVLATAVQDPPMRIEILVQILRMLAGNEDADSVARGEALLGMCLMSFPVEPVLELWLLRWLKKRVRQPEALRKYWAALENVRYGQPNKVFNKSVSQLRDEWDKLTLSSFALRPGQSSGPTDPSQLSHL